MRVLFIRHAQSENNNLQDNIEKLVQAKELDSAAALKKWYSERSSDADLTVRGKEEAEKLGVYYAGVLDGEDVVAYTSGMLRTCKTIAPLAKRMHLDVRVHPELHEEGGIYKTDPETKQHSLGDVRTAQDIANSFNYDISLLPSTGPWYTHPRNTLESREECKNRARKIAGWLYSQPLHDEVGDRLLIIVSHQHFLTYLFSALVGVTTESLFLIGNTETAFAVLDPKTKTSNFRWIGKGDHLTRYLAPRQGLSLARL
eukprot:TRINITY_DN3739_c0_g2_i2.p1 TRINITY_DN3739_c0_g2~~TRINITY_DN3739_c0_g2_i2.p1  ORF type:complete len:257 (+),score=37.67 TRINITY_DN3739_c0_g2_i2:55-825(+)